MQSALNEQKEAFTAQIEGLEAQLRNQIAEKNQLNDKNETLLEYAKENMDRQDGRDSKLNELDTLRQVAESRAQKSHDDATALEKDLHAKQALLDQVKRNLEEIRTEKIAMQAHVKTLQSEKEDLQRKLNDIKGEGQE